MDHVIMFGPGQSAESRAPILHLTRVKNGVILGSLKYNNFYYYQPNLT